MFTIKRLNKLYLSAVYLKKNDMENCLNIDNIKFTGPDKSIIQKFRSREKDIVLKNRILFLYGINNKTQSFKSPLTGVIEKIYVNLGDTIDYGQVLFDIIPGCPHSTLLKDICAICGEEVLKEEKNNMGGYIPLIHKIPELKHAIIMGEADEKRLIKERRLILIVDLDQTLIHTTNEDVPADMEGVHHYQLPNSYPNWYHTMCRPHTTEFLANLSKYFELHICTFGARSYAHTIANIIDIDGKLFSHRILSRDEFIDPYSKTANLKYIYRDCIVSFRTLFPFGDSLVCIIDDREDVWNFVPNVVHVKPYKFFNCSEEINFPPGSALQPDSSLSPNCKANGLSQQNDNGQIDETCSIQDKIEIATSVSQGLEYSSEMPINDTTDKDDYLFYLEDILINIHQQFYEAYDKMLASNLDLPSLKTLIPEIRGKVLSGVNIVFSGVFPKHVALENSKERKIALSLGASVSPDIEANITTHLIAAIKGTNKIHRAKNLGGIHIVAIEWLISCYERWERASEALFPLNESPETITEFKTKNIQGVSLQDWKLLPFEQENTFHIHHHSQPLPIVAQESSSVDREIDKSASISYYDKLTGKKITKHRAEKTVVNSLSENVVKSSFSNPKTTFDRVPPIKPLSEDLIKNMEQEIYDALNDSDDDDKGVHDLKDKLNDDMTWFAKNPNFKISEKNSLKSYKRKKR